MRVERSKCDNPRCDNTEVPESADAPAGTKYIAPYGWLMLSGFFVGTGPKITVEVCSTACLQPAVDHLVDQDRDR